MAKVQSAIELILQFLELSCAPIYVLLAITTIASTLSPFLQDLSSHGKTRLSIDGTSAQCSNKSRNSGSNVLAENDGNRSNNKNASPSSTIKSSLSLFSRIRSFILNDDALILSKRRFLDFYSVGFLLHITLMISTCRSSCLPSSRNKMGDVNRSTIDITTIGELLWTTRSPIASLLLLAHLLRRCYECRHVHVWNGSVQETTVASKTEAPKVMGGTNARSTKRRTKMGNGGYMHVAGYLLGILHYVLLPFVFVLSTRPEVATSNYCSMNVSSFRNSDNTWQGWWGGWSNRTDGFEIMNTLLSFGSDGSWCQRWCRTILMPPLGVAEACWIILGVSLNLLGQTEQHKHHRLLAECRRRNRSSQDNAQNRVGPQVDQSGASVETTDGDGLEHRRYCIPHGRWFENVSCPHYFAEVLIYISFFILLQYSTKNDEYCANNTSTSVIWNQAAINLQSTGKIGVLLNYVCQSLRTRKELALLVWVVFNLTVSSKSTHLWYLNYFKLDYPKGRKILIPYVW